MTTHSKGADIIFIMLMSITIFALSIKGDGSIEFLTVHYPPIINAIKNNAQPIAFAMLIFIAIIVVKKQRFIKLTFAEPLFWLFVYKLILGTRLVFTDIGLDIKQVISFFLVVVIYFYICCRTYNYQDGITNIIKIIFFAAAILCIINMYNALFNYAGSSWKGRLFGIYTHPNFLAVNHATIIAISLGYLSERKNRFFNHFRYGRMLCIFNIVASVILLILSGSRTGIIGFVAALIVYGLLNYKKNMILTIALSFLVIILMTLFFVNMNSLAQGSSGLSRILNAGNTRADVWGGMWRDFVSSPILGVGGLSQGTSGSYLKILSVGGIVLFIPFLMMFLLLIKECFYQVKMRNYIFLYPIACLLSCAITEGILTEGASYPILTLLLILIALFFSRKRDRAIKIMYVQSLGSSLGRK
jgi:O-antigen ligase